MALREILDKQAKMFEPNGKLEKLYPLWEAQDTFLYTPGEVTKADAHVRDALDQKRLMGTVIIALLPAVAMCLFNVGMQANVAASASAELALDSWQTTIFRSLGFGFESTLVGNIVHGALYFVPAFFVTLVFGGLSEAAFALVRGHEISEGFLVTLFLYPLSLPPTIPLWQAALGILFGVIIGKEIFGGVGMNILNPALTARAFLFFAYPADISGSAKLDGTQVWRAAYASDTVDGMSGATWLSKAANHGMGAEGLAGLDWMDAFIGTVPGSMGETSALACLIGAGILIATGIGSWRTMLGVVLGTAGMATLLNAVGSDTNPFFEVPAHYHMVLGGWAFGMVFMATEPVTSPFTDKGKLIYGALIGVLVVLVRVVNPAYPEGMMLAILFMNMFAPFIDHFYVQANIKRRLARAV
jgi:Na+-transporting NADH:ubiquinone oxidoreductase subunit B